MPVRTVILNEILVQTSLTEGPVNSRAMAAASETPFAHSEPGRSPGAASTPKKVLQAMLDRLFASIMSGPSMNCRPHNSRQRIDLFALGALQSISPEQVLKTLMSTQGKVTVDALVKAPSGMGSNRWKKGTKANKASSDESVLQGDAAEVDPSLREAWNAQQQVLSKLRIIAQEATTYEQDTGVYVLNLGLPLLSLPPGIGTAQGTPSTRRILAPLAFMPIVVEITAGATTKVAFSCASDDIDRVHPNESLLAWIEQSTGTRIELAFHDEKGQDPWREIRDIARAVCDSLGIAAPGDIIQEKSVDAAGWRPTPRHEELGDEPQVVLSSVAGLFPLAKQGLLRDTKEMLAEQSIAGPVRSFLTIDPDHVGETKTVEEHTVAARQVSEDRLVGPADPCQAYAVAKARTSPVLVVHGPPGTGKSQTITNIIGDSLIRGERVLFVCEKRTALDVVANRLSSVGLSDLCAVIHDPQRDQRSLYLSIRNQLESLSETTFDPTVESKLQAVSAEMHHIHGELTQLHSALHRSSQPGSDSLHDCIGKWLALGVQGDSHSSTNVAFAESLRFSPSELDSLTVPIRDVLSRATDIAFGSHPWREVEGTTIQAYFARPMEGVRAAVTTMVQTSEAIDGAPSEIPLPATPGPEHARTLAKLTGEFPVLLQSTSHQCREFWLTLSHEELLKHSSHIDQLHRLHSELVNVQNVRHVIATACSTPPSATSCHQALAAIRTYLPVSTSWIRYISFGKRAAAASALAPLGLALNNENLAQAQAVYVALLAMQGTTDVLKALGVPASPADTQLDPVATLALLDGHIRWARWCKELSTIGLNPPASERLRTELRSADHGRACDMLRKAAERAARINACRDAIDRSELVAKPAIDTFMSRVAAGESITEDLRALQDHLDTLDDVLRIRETLGNLPTPIAQALSHLTARGVSVDEGVRLLHRHALSVHISERLASEPMVRHIDAKRIGQLFDRFASLISTRELLCQQRAKGRWVESQRAQLLVGTGSKLNSTGAAIKTRLVVRGSNALRLRQVMQHGARTEGGDPLFDLRPVWMASPETVAQVFPREPLFDVLIFDEASQLKLEDALPVLTRAKRIVIAGDPKQLPPTRFFESAVAAIADDEDAVTDSELFETQQAKSEDLLSSALGMNVDQSYLDVHYRSRYSDLIEFSNEYFYGGRLQAIPSHPSRLVAEPPLKLYEVPGIYSKSANIVEAERVVQIVRELLSSQDPPSIGIGCFNIVQRDLISELLDEAAESDTDFAERLAKAKELVRRESFEGLFVKNLENVQGDERDHIIISTTYGPDDSGKFRRNFGPLNMPGGGRRLNVLVTRARHEIHLITSVPRSQFISLPIVPADSTPGGGWLLFAYLNFALQLQQASASRQDNATDHRITSAQIQNIAQPHIVRGTTRSPSQLVESFAESLLRHGSPGGSVYWGNDGFAIDHALAHHDAVARMRGAVSLGIQCDFARFALAQDQVEWDIFRSGILRSSGWDIHRVWSPAIFRDLEGQSRLLLKLAQSTLDKQS